MMGGGVGGELETVGKRVEHRGFMVVRRMA